MELLQPCRWNTWVAGLIIVLMLFSSGCAVSSLSPEPPPPPPEPDNSAPVITSITVLLPHTPLITIGEKEEPMKISRWSTAEIECIAEDPDDDELTFNWSATGGKITQRRNIIGWTAPAVADNYTVTVNISDGNGGRTEASMVFEALCCGH